MSQEIPSIARIIRASEASRLIGISRRTLFRLVKSGSFPPPYRLSDSLLGWKETDVAAWIESRPKLIVETPLEKQAHSVLQKALSEPQTGLGESLAQTGASCHRCLEGQRLAVGWRDQAGAIHSARGLPPTSSDPEGN